MDDLELPFEALALQFHFGDPVGDDGVAVLLEEGPLPVSLVSHPQLPSQVEFASWIVLGMAYRHQRLAGGVEVLFGEQASRCVARLSEHRSKVLPRARAFSKRANRNPLP